jgi:CBS domain-containing protein
MQEKNFRHLPVVENDQVLGIISMRNLLGLMLQQLSYERDLLKQCMDK